MFTSVVMSSNFIHVKNIDFQKRSTKNSLSQRLFECRFEGVQHQHLLSILWNLNASFLLQVLIIGGGVGGTVREVTKHPLVESITVCDIDQVRKCVHLIFNPIKSLVHTKYAFFFSPC